MPGRRIGQLAERADRFDQAEESFGLVKLANELHNQMEVSSSHVVVSPERQQRD